MLVQEDPLEEGIDGGAWWTTVHRVTQGQTWLKRLSTHTLYRSQEGSLCGALPSSGLHLGNARCLAFHHSQLFPQLRSLLACKFSPVSGTTTGLTSFVPQLSEIIIFICLITISLKNVIIYLSIHLYLVWLCCLFDCRQGFTLSWPEVDVLPHQSVTNIILWFSEPF